MPRKNAAQKCSAKILPKNSFQKISPKNLAKSYEISPNLMKSCQILQNLTKSYEKMPIKILHIRNNHKLHICHNHKLHINCTLS